MESIYKVNCNNSRCRALALSLSLDEHRQRNFSRCNEPYFVHSLKDFKLLQEVHQHPEHPGGAFWQTTALTLLSSGNDKQKSERWTSKAARCFTHWCNIFQRPTAAGSLVTGTAPSSTSVC